MNAVVAVESGFVAVGSEGGESDPLRPSYPPSDSFETQGVVWRSDDGVSWERVPHDDVLSERDTGLVMNDVVFDGSRLVAVGGAFHRTAPFATYRWGPSEPPPSDVDIDVDAAVWSSDDGVTWRRVGAGDEAFGGDTIRRRSRDIGARCANDRNDAEQAPFHRALAADKAVVTADRRAAHPHRRECQAISSDRDWPAPNRG